MRTTNHSPAPIKRKTPKPEARSYQFLTYVFGGGVKVLGHEKHRDPITPVRVASIRGQLRFWWRACNPKGCQNLEALRQREAEVWGDMSRPSKVEIAVLSQPSLSREVRVYEYNPRGRTVPCKGMREIAYGAFPLQPRSEEQKARPQPGVLFDYGSSAFTLSFTYPEDVRQDVKAALWAWETFGGLGGRTRRGFGAVLRKDENPSGKIESELARYRENPKIPGVPSLHHARFARSSQANVSALEAWKKALKTLLDMRQGPDFGRNPPLRDSKKPAGRSRWPEPDQIRLRARAAAPIHDRPVVEVDRFPRAVFGMPIVFHFHPGSREELGSQGDPDMKPLQLQPVGFERFASPLILRPIPDGQGFRASALALDSNLPAIEFKVKDETFPVQWQLDDQLASRIPALTRNGRTFIDPIDLFLAELSQ
jgi:CRISPR-associated protein Cmr1